MRQITFCESAEAEWNGADAVFHRSSASLSQQKAISSQKFFGDPERRLLSILCVPLKKYRLLCHKIFPSVPLLIFCPPPAYDMKQ